MTDEARVSVRVSMIGGQTIYHAQWIGDGRCTRRRLTPIPESKPFYKCSGCYATRLPYQRRFKSRDKCAGSRDLLSPKRCTDRGLKS
jgi:hypothetical protein